MNEISNSLIKYIILTLVSISCSSAVTWMICALMAISCSPVVTEQQGKAVLDYTDRLAQCRAVGREAGTYSAYEACTKDAGL